MVVSLYAALLALMFVGLSVIVIRGRGAAKVALGDGGHSLLQRGVRAHANFAEYTPLFVIMLAIAEYQGLPRVAVHGFGVLFCLGRVSHAFSLLKHEPAHGKFVFRVSGMMATFGCLSVLAAVLLYQFFQ